MLLLTADVAGSDHRYQVGPDTDIAVRVGAGVAIPDLLAITNKVQ